MDQWMKQRERMEGWVRGIKRQTDGNEAVSELCHTSTRLFRHHEQLSIVTSAFFIHHTTHSFQNFHYHLAHYPCRVASVLHPQ